MNQNRFVNPYNFIPFPEKKAAAYKDGDKHYGVIRYSITTKTPLFIPNSSNDTIFSNPSQKDHKSYDFYSYTDLSNDTSKETHYYEPVVPGTEMRGLIRSVYETLTDSCMGLLNEDIQPIKRVQKNYSPGLLAFKDGELSLYPAKSYMIGEKITGRSYAGSEIDNMRNGQKVYFELPRVNEYGRMGAITNFSMRSDSCKKLEGYIIKWGKGVKKAYNHVFVFKDEYHPVSNGKHLDSQKIKAYVESVIDSYDPSSNKIKDYNSKDYKAYKTDFQDFMKKREGVFPINYKVIKENLYLCPTSYPREKAAHSIGDLAKEFVPCKDTLCPACDLFGKIGDNAKSSHIRFTDMKVAEQYKTFQEYYVKVDGKSEVTLSNLSEPKLGNVEFYLEKPSNASFWTYDYYVANGCEFEEPGKLRGRKYYWHHPGKIIFQKVEQTNLNKTIRPVKTGITFTGEVYFDGISKKQLNQLVWILNNGGEKRGYKLGMAKPLGLGSISCKVNAVEERIVQVHKGKVEYTILPLEYTHVTYESAGFSSNPKVKEAFLKITSFDAVPKDMQVCYPKVMNKDNGFTWFIKNRISLSKGVTIKEFLPSIDSKDISLPCYYHEPKTDSYNSNSRYAGNKTKNRFQGNRK